VNKTCKQCGQELPIERFYKGHDTCTHCCWQRYGKVMKKSYRTKIEASVRERMNYIRFIGSIPYKHIPWK
jgi:hypothetical protein